MSLENRARSWARKQADAWEAEQRKKWEADKEEAFQDHLDNLRVERDIQTTEELKAFEAWCDKERERYFGGDFDDEFTYFIETTRPNVEAQFYEDFMKRNEK